MDTIEADFLRILEDINDGVLVLDEDLNIYYSNRYAKFLLGIPEKPEGFFLRSDELNEISLGYLKSLEIEKNLSRFPRLGITEFKRDKRIDLIDVTINTLEKGKRILILKNVTDVIGLMDSIVTRETQFSHLFHSIPDLLLLTNNNKTILMSNQSVKSTLGWIPSNSIGTNFEEYVHNEDKQLFSDLYDKTLDTSEIQVATIRVQNRSGGYSFVEFYTYSDHENNSGRVYYLGRDVTEKYQYENLLIEKISKDDLTKLFSKKYLFEAMERLIRENSFGKIKDYYLFYINIDRFKDINDSLGHFAGDALLRKFAIQLTKIKIDSSEVTVGRIGGDEFCIIISSYSTRLNPDEIYQEIQKSYSNSFEIEGHALNITCSIGIVKGNKNHDNAEKIFRHATIALHEAKKKGLGKYCIFENKMQEKKINSLQLSQWLRLAAANNDLKLYLQPIVSLKDDLLSHSEALCRWNHATLGSIPPSDFIQIAEETGQIHIIGDWMLKSICQLFEKWDQQGKKIMPIALNLSPLQFENPKLPIQIASYLSEYDLIPQNIHVELTESLIMSNIKHSTKVLNQLKEMGLTIYLDDFGTGYSSLNYLIHFPIDIIKIDKSFIDSILVSKNGLSVVKAIIKMAESLSMKVVAEGVESKDQYEILKEIGCDYAQGYYISKPIPDDDFLRVSKDNSLFGDAIIY